MKVFTREYINGNVWKGDNTFYFTRTNWYLLGIRVWSKLEWA
jgi:hypothetical protein